MPIDPNNFWDDNYYDNPPLADEMVVAAEQRLGVRLPAEYIALLRIQNGGYTKGFEFPMSQWTSWSADHIPLSELSGIGPPDDLKRLSHNIYNRDYMTREWGLPEKQVLLSGDGHWWITLDYRHRPEPAVSWIDVEVHEDIVAATTFAQFLDALRPEMARDP
jgi:SMI1/KNR4 family protein SUKH-1